MECVCICVCSHDSSRDVELARAAQVSIAVLCCGAPVATSLNELKLCGLYLQATCRHMQMMHDMAAMQYLGQKWHSERAARNSNPEVGEGGGAAMLPSYNPTIYSAIYSSIREATLMQPLPWHLTVPLIHKNNNRICRLQKHMMCHNTSLCLQNHLLLFFSNHKHMSTEEWRVLKNHFSNTEKVYTFVVETQIALKVIKTNGQNHHIDSTPIVTPQYPIVLRSTQYYSKRPFHRYLWGMSVTVAAMTAYGTLPGSAEAISWIETKGMQCCRCPFGIPQPYMSWQAQ